MVETRRLIELGSKLSDLASFPGGPLLVALSGGPDSTALAYLAARSGAELRAVHVDHGTSHAESFRIAATEICHVLGIDLEIVTVDLSGSAFTEERARQERYQVFTDLRKTGEWVLTGHSRDDQAETVLMHLIRGAGPAGMAGIPTRTNQMVARPLLGIARADLRELATLAGLRFVDDPANEDADFTRNAIRMTVIPLVESRFNPRFSEALARSAGALRRDIEFLDHESSVLPVEIAEGHSQAARSVLITAPRPLADRAVRRMVTVLRPPYGPSSDEMDLIWGVIGGSTTGARLGHGLEVLVSGPLFVVRKTQGEDSLEARTELGVGSHRLGRWVLEVTRFNEPARSIPLSVRSAVFPVDTSLTASSDEGGRVTVEAGGEPAWVPGVKRLPVAFYQSGSTGYLSVFATEVEGWR